MSTNVEKRKLSELGVVDLRSELEKRELDKSGLKQVLVDRLNKALVDAGEDPATFEFQVEKKSPKRLSTQADTEVISKVKVEENGAAEVDKINNTKDQESEPKKENEPKEDETIKVEPSSESDHLIQLTLDEQEESFQDEEEIDSTGKTDMEPDKLVKEDAKNSNTNLDTSKDQGDTGEKKEDKTHEGKSSSSVRVSSSKSSSNSRTNRQNRNLWITNITQTTKATELKQVLSSHGKVIGAKVVINAKYPGACCYGYVTMDTIEDADNCIAKLNNTELNGKIIRIEKVRPDHMNNAKADPKKVKTEESTSDKKEKDKSSSNRSKSRDKKSDDKKKESEKEKDKREQKDGNTSDASAKRDSKRKSRDHSKARNDDSGGRRSRSRQHREILTFDKIKEERERQRFRERERMLREESRRRREEAARQRDVDRSQRSEAARLDREREKLRFEREKLEREKAEIIRLERERQKVEREKLELEKLQLQRVKMRFHEEELRPVKRPAPFRRDEPFDDRKRPSGAKRYEEPSGLRYQSPSTKVPSPPAKKFTSTPKDYKSSRVYDKRESYSKNDRDYDSKHSQSTLSREAPTSITKYEGSSVFNINHERDARTSGSALPPPRIPKDSRYVERDRDRSPHYRRSLPEHKSEARQTHNERSYETVKERERNSGNNSWAHPSPAQSKSFGASSSMPYKTWSKDSWRPEVTSNGERWSTVPRGEPSCPPPPSMENYTRGRFEYKPIRSIRKY